MDKKTLQIRSSPHISGGDSVEKIMRNVVYALLPTVAFAVYAFGQAGLLVLLTAVLSCVMAEHVLCKLTTQSTSINDWSVTITGIIYGLTLPPGLPLWMVFLGGFIAVGLGKFLFGGLGFNPFNPALVGRAFLQAAFPVSMTTWLPAFSADRFTTLPGSTLTLPFASPAYDSATGATPLAAMKFEAQVTDSVDLFLGLSNGSVGETCSLVILLGGIYLIARKMMNWRIPAAIFLTVLLLSGGFHLFDAARYPSPLFMLFSGGLMLGAMFMATDMVASPLTNIGCFIYGVLIGVIVVVIRLWGGMPEGVMYAILIANAISPHIDRLVQPRVFGTPVKLTKNK